MNLLNTGKDLKRLNEIVSILAKYGFGDMIRRMGLSESVEQAGKLVRYPVQKNLLHLKPAVRTRHAMEEMGPTFVKLGQILATRVDLFPQEWITEFEKLQDDTPALPFAELLPQIEASLKKPILSVFETVDEKPLGTASMAQVHKATTKNGQLVVLKIRKPDIRRKIEGDLRLLQHIAKLAASRSEELRRYSPVELVHEFERSLLRELDFTIECRNAERIGKNLKSLSFITVPKVYWKWTCEDLNVQEYIQGIPSKNIRQLKAKGLDTKLIASRVAAMAWKSMLENGFFHADPHPGNFLILPHNQIAMLDFGMVGKLSRHRREQLVKLTRYIVMQDAENVAGVLLEWSEASSLNFSSLVSETEDFIERFYGVPLDQIDINQLLSDITGIMRNHELALPPDIALLSKACITLEGFGRLLNPQFDIMVEATPLIKGILKTRYSPTSLAKKLGIRAINIVDRLYDEPKSPQMVASSKPLPMAGIDRQFIERVIKRSERAKFRQTQAMLLSASLIASALFSLIPSGPHFLGIHILAYVGFGLVSIQTFLVLFLMWWDLQKLD
ncbi:MAG: phosphotransferase [Pseudomonadales bacterium]|nr:phosphotransferase [Pseudomonadales bacterium]